MNDAEAEALLIALGSALDWKPGIYPATRHHLYARNELGNYIISQTHRTYRCHFSLLVSPYDRDDWEYEPTSLDIAKRACDRHAAKGVWPTGIEEGWEFTKL